MTELRPCIVHIQEKIERFTDAISGHKKPILVQKAEEHSGYFHGWFNRYWTVGESPMIGGYSAGQMSKTVAIVEYEDGTVHEHLPHEIQFTDRGEKNEIQKEAGCG